MTELSVLYILIGLSVQSSSFQEIAPSDFNVKVRTKTDTGGWVEYTKEFEITILKELGKIHP